MATPEQLALLAAYTTQTTSLRARVVAAIESLWRALSSWRDDDINRFAAQAVPIVLGGQAQVAAFTAAYLAQARSFELGTPFRPVRVRPSLVTGAAVRNGADPFEVYRRAGVQVWRDLADERPLADAVDHGQFRATQAAETDMQLAKTHTAREVLADDEVATGYERVLVGDENCGLCVIASTHRYFKEDLLPIHPSCDCTVRPLWGEEGVPQVINRERLDAAHAAIEERVGQVDRGGRAPDYRKLILVRQHGELGPTLTVARHHFDGPKAAEASGLDLTDLPGRAR